MDNKEIARKIVNTKPYENLKEILGDELGGELYKLVDSVLYKGGVERRWVHTGGGLCLC